MQNLLKHEPLKIIWRYELCSHSLIGRAESIHMNVQPRLRNEDSQIYV